MFNFEKKRDSSFNDLLSLKLNKSLCFEHLPFHIYHIRHFRLLRVLTITRGDIDQENDYLLNEIAMLVHLRYLKIRTAGFKALPLSFSNLLNLETLVVNNHGETPLSLEPVIWNLTMLRHVEINQCCLYDLGTDEPALVAEDSKLENLRILGSLEISCYEGPVDISKRVPNLQKLHCSITKVSQWFPQFGFLSELEELTLNYTMSLEVIHKSKFSFFPLGLRYLQLGYASVNCYSLSTIARLPNLEELRLRYICIQGKKWNMIDNDAFKNLKLLYMDWVAFSEWKVGEELFPVLERLILKRCEELKEIPPSFGDVYSLKTIKLIDSPQLEESAQEIKRYVEDNTGEDKLEVLVRNIVF